MIVYFVSDGWDEGENVWNTTFYANKENAEAEVENRVTKLHEDEECRYNRKLQDWNIKNAAIQAAIAAGLPIPRELSWVANSPPKKKVINHSITVESVEVME